MNPKTIRKIAEALCVSPPPPSPPIGVITVGEDDPNEFDWGTEGVHGVGEDVTDPQPPVPLMSIQHVYSLPPLKLVAYLRAMLAGTVYSAEFGCNVVSKYDEMLRGMLFNGCLSPSGWSVGSDLSFMLDLGIMIGLHSRTAKENLEPGGNEGLAINAVALTAYYMLLAQLASPVSSRISPDSEVESASSEGGAA